MSSADAPHWTVLVAHPDTQRGPVSGIAVEVRRPTAATLVCNYSLYGTIGRVRVPGARADHGADGLWQHTCFEAFLAAPGIPGYYEFNFSPTLAWAAYQFTDYRDGIAPASLTQAPGLQVRRSSDQLELRATVHLAGLTSLCDARPLRLALAAVIEDHRGELSYWALEHPPGKPDFHHPDSFTLELDAS
ncbi:MAG TPA: DOMON-like domain-containing protein [Steroidobacteraceae bacterium]